MKIPAPIKKLYDSIPMKPGIAIFIGFTVIFFLCLSLKGFILNHMPFVTKSEYSETIKSIEKNQKIVDSLFVEVRKRDVLIAGLKAKQTQLEATKVKNRNTLKNAKGNIAILDSIADGIL